MKKSSRGRTPTASERQEWERFSKTADPLTSSAQKRKARQNRQPQAPSNAIENVSAKAARGLTWDELEDWDAYLRAEQPKDPAKTSASVRTRSQDRIELPDGPMQRVAQQPFGPGDVVADPSEGRISTLDDSRRTSAGSPVDRKLLRQLKSGRAAPDAQIDLHGMTCAEAERTVRYFVTSASRTRKRIVLIITGKGRDNGTAGTESERKGIIKEMVPKLLNAPFFQEIVWHFQSAHQRHGGSGALYVFLKRTRGDH